MAEAHGPLQNVAVSMSMEGPLCPGPGCAPRVKPYLLPMGQALAMERDAKEERSVLVPHKQKEGVP